MMTRSQIGDFILGWRWLAPSLGAAALALWGGCSEAHIPNSPAVHTEDISQVVYHYRWLKDNVDLQQLRVDRVEGNLLRVCAQLHLKEPHKLREVCVRTDFYSPPMDQDGRQVDSSGWKAVVLEPRKRVQYEAVSLVPADDFRIHVTYADEVPGP